MTNSLPEVDPLDDEDNLASQSSQPITRSVWTPADFLDKAQELRLRLSQWHRNDSNEPIWMPGFVELQKAVRQTFRKVVMQGAHGPRPATSQQLYTGRVPEDVTDAKVVGSAFTNLPATNDRQLTRWLLRDFVEHLPDAGATEQAKYLRLKVDRILDAPIYRQRRPVGIVEQQWLEKTNSQSKDGPHGLIGGKKLPKQLLMDLVAAAKRLQASHALPMESDQADMPATALSPKPKRRGRKADYDTVQYEKRITEEWVQARATGVYKVDFAKEKNIKVRELNLLLDRIAARNRRSDK